MYYKSHFIKKKLGQVFLKDLNIIHDIIKIINIKKKQKIIEIGPGLGALTQHIMNIVEHLIVIEKDVDLVKKLLKIPNKKNLKIFNRDVLQFNFFHLTNINTPKLRLIGNLPYYISTKLIIHLFKYINIIHDMHFMFQKEVAKRLLALPNSKEYGSLSVIAQYHYKITPLLNIPMTAFTPIPKVESMMIKLLPHTIPPYPLINTTQLSFLIKLAFSQRRKLIKNSLSTLFNTTEMTQQGIDTKLRAENLTIHQYCILTNMLQKKLFHNK